MRQMCFCLGAMLTVLSYSSWSAAADADKSTEQPGDKPAARAAGPFDKQLLEIGGEYLKWGRVDDEYRWAPWLCRMPEPGGVKFSKSDDQGTHGQKLYSLFAHDRKAYLGLTKDVKIKPGQAVVKQSWTIAEITEAKAQPPKRIDLQRVVQTETSPAPKNAESFSERYDHFYPYAWRGDKVYKADKPAGLFVMLKLDPKTADTDQGWVYGTLTADGKQVTAAGKLESCIKCHLEAKNDRLFGLAL